MMAFSTREELEIKESPHTKQMRFLLFNNVPPLKTITILPFIEKLLEQYDTIEEVEEFTKNDQTGIYHQTDLILEQIKSLAEELHTLIDQNEIEKVDALLYSTSIYLLPILLKSKINSNTALMKSLGLLAFGRIGTQLCFVSTLDDNTTTFKTLKLMYNEVPTPHFSYLYANTIWTVEPGAEPNQLGIYQFNALKEMFNNPDLQQKKLNLDNLSDFYPSMAYADLLKITLARGHTLFVHETSMVEVLKHHMRRAWPLTGAVEHEIGKQTAAQFPTDWERNEEKQHQRDLIQLNKIRKLIVSAPGNSDDGFGGAVNFQSNAILDGELENFKKYFAQNAKTQTTGIYGKPMLLLSSLKFKRNNTSVNKFYYVKIVGFLQSIEPVNRKQNYAQGLYKSLYGEKSKRTLQFGGRKHDIFYLDDRVGELYWVSMPRGYAAFKLCRRLDKHDVAQDNLDTFREYFDNKIFLLRQHISLYPARCRSTTEIELAKNIANNQMYTHNVYILINKCVSKYLQGKSGKTAGHSSYHKNCGEKKLLLDTILEEISNIYKKTGKEQEAVALFRIYNGLREVNLSDINSISQFKQIITINLEVIETLSRDTRGHVGASITQLFRTTTLDNTGSLSRLLNKDLYNFIHKYESNNLEFK